MKFGSSNATGFAVPARMTGKSDVAAVQNLFEHNWGDIGEASLGPHFPIKIVFHSGTDLEMEALVNTETMKVCLFI